MATWSAGSVPPRGGEREARAAAAGAAGPGLAPRVELLGCPLDPVTMDEAVARAVAWCRGERRPHVLVTVNVAHLVAMRSDPAFARACRAGDLVVADGLPVVWASRIAGAPLPGRVAGCDLMPRLLEAAAALGLPVYFLGARDEVVRALADVSVRRHPGLRVAGYRDGYFAPEESERVVAEVRRSGAAMLFVGMPSPAKDVWCEQHRDGLGVPLILGVGGSFDVLAGFVRRAPAWMQRAGLEWLWRVAMEPRRLFWRYLSTNTIFVGRLAVELARRLARAGAAAAP
ncbi:MAG TPA: WecB/TagA/CpsF family glycosyltransferase [Anaeromyxobacter sp.]